MWINRLVYSNYYQSKEAKRERGDLFFMFNYVFIESVYYGYACYGKRTLE